MRLTFMAVSIITVIFCLPASSSAVFLGPYSGQVIDSRTGDPISGASLIVYWKKVLVVPGLGGQSSLLDSKLVHTDDNGDYGISFELAWLWPGTFLESTTIVVYQPGYQAFIKEIQGKDAGEGFRYINNTIKLDRVPPNFDYTAHYKSIIEALDDMGEVPFIPPNRHGAFYKAETVMPWDLYMEKALQRNAGEVFLRRVEWESNRE